MNNNHDNYLNNKNNQNIIFAFFFFRYMYINLITKRTIL